MNTRTAPRIVTVLAAVFLSLAVVVTGPAKPAAAWATPPAPITIGTLAKSAPVRMLTMTSPWGLALNGAALAGIALYETQDSWWPVVEGLFNDEQTSTTSATGCTYTVQLTAVRGPAVNQATVTSSRGTCTGPTSGYNIYFDQVSCRTPAGILSGATANINTVSHATNTTISRTATLCPSDSEVVQFRVQQCWSTGGSGCSSPRSNAVTYLGQIAPAEWTSTTTVQCKQSDGTIVTITDTLTGHPDKVAVPSCADRVPGSIPWSATVNGGPAGGITRDLITITTNQSVFDEYAACFGPTGLVCSIRVFIGGEPCVRGDLACVDWKQYAIDHPSRVECRFGSYVVNLNQCDVLKHAYKTKTQTVVETDPDGNPITDPDAGTDPGTGTGTFPETGTNPGSTPATDPSADPDSSSCWGSGWSWNPVSWVYIPVKCALKWAFVPSTGFMDGKVASLRDSLSGTMPGAFVDAFGAQDYTLSEGGCGGIPVQWGIEGQNFSFTLLEACSGFMATTAGIVKLAASAGLVIFGAIGCLRGLGAGFGWSPSIGRGSDSA